VSLATIAASLAVDDRDRTAQALRALLDANRTRVEKSNVKRDLRAGGLTLAKIAVERPEPLQSMPLFALLLELPGFGCRRLDKLNRRAIADGINLARTLGDASASTLNWLVRAVDGQLDDEATRKEPSAWTRAVDADPAAPAASLRPLYGVVGSYPVSGGKRRRLVLSTADDDTPVLLDRGCGDERVVERFRATARLLEVAAVAGGYLEEARRLGRPVVAAGNSTTRLIGAEEQAR
jgi:hypothetical protein